MKLLFTMLLTYAFVFNAFAQEPAGDSTLLIAPAFFKAKGLSLSNSNQRLKFYVNHSDIDASISQIYDIRWTFDTHSEARKYLKNNIDKISEGGIEYKKDIKLPNATDIHLYREANYTMNLYNMIGAPHVHWYIVFIVDKAIVKIFTDGVFTQFNEIYSIAKEAAVKASHKYGKSFIDKSYILPENILNSGFQTKIENANVTFKIPSGYEIKELDKDLKDYYDQEFDFPNEDLVLRTYIVPPQNSKENDDEDEEEFIKLKKGAAFSIFMNIYMPLGKDLDKILYKETNDTSECKKKFNGAFMIEAKSNINKKSQLGKGYKFAYFVAFYKHGCGDCYAIYFANDEKKLSLFSQLTHKTFCFK